MRRRAVGALLLAVATAACSGSRPDRPAPSPSPSATASASPGAVTASASAGATPSSTVLTLPSPGSSLAPGQVLPADDPSAPPVATRGVVKIGFFISDDASAVYKSLGISGPAFSREESKRLWQSIIDQVNRRGGIAGHRVVGTYYFIASDSGTNASRAQAACDQFTQDEKVVAVVMDGASDLSTARCLAARRTPVVDVGQTSYPYDDEDLRSLAPHLYLPGRLSMSRFATYVDQLAAHGFFAKGSKVGLLRFDLPDQERTARRVIEPALKRHGLALTTDIAFRPVQGTADLPVASDQASNAVLRMRTAGVDHVLFLGSGLSLPYVFPTVAESQGYRPRYGITTDDGPAFMAENAPAAQMTGAMAVGWEPQYDVADSDAVLRDQPQWRACVAVVRRAGFTARDGRRCTGLYFLEAALRNGSAVTPAALRAGADGLGTGAYSTQTYATRFGPGRYDGVGAVRVLRVEPSCTCFRYLTGNLRV